ncbi:helix-turn-helix transcriptional regulator [Mangrovihabitans endophyticus]|uniref:HTH luxR-type domain-containing protein n=1 Tax=Mangrovihabitans endophyticus TaxID=1751298 RepID=A0A8J3FPG5_9ACTN|nr:helix-turn-helix transcriptional regulator [Mangrovihabitans endophyticus]GGL01097.1 hypothetical protein GCM10012284_39560 [Mangrovihabitans endophyticus]
MAKVPSSGLDAPDLGDDPARHLLAARELLAQGAPIGAVADRLVAAGGSAEPWALRALRDAAAEAVVRGREDEARRLLELVLRAGPDAGVQAELADIDWWLRPAGSVSALTALARSPALPPVAAAVLARRLGWHGLVDDAAALLDDAAPTGLERAITDLWLNRLYPSTFPDRGAEPAVDAVAATHPWLRPTAAAEAVLQGLHINRDALEPLQTALLALDDAEDLDAETPWFADLLASARSSASRTAEALLTAARARTELRRGELHAAEELAEVSLRRLTPTGWGVLVGLPLGTALQALTEQGRHDEVADRLWGQLPPALGRTPYGLVFLRARGLHYLATGRERAALSDFLAAGEIQESWGVSFPGLSPWMVDAARAHLALGDTQAARTLADRQLAVLGGSRPRVRAGALRVRAATLAPGRRPQLLRAAIELLEQCGDRLELARCLADLGWAFEEAGEPQYAPAPLSRAWHLASDAAAGLLLREFAARGLTGPPSGPADDARLAALSEAERRVAELAAQGYKNREIARRLFLTASTVEQHLTRIYRKLGVRRRSALASIAGLAPAVEVVRPRRSRNHDPQS